jgi:UDP:flavonoid glycosyltransferase YjiC (YdhE family)
MGTSRRRILFLAEGATMTHFVRPLALAGSLDPATYEVHFYSPARFAPLLYGSSFSTGTLDTMPGEQFLAHLAKGSPLFPVDVVRRYVAEDRSLIRTLRPDLVVGDMRPSLPISARLEGVPCAVLMNAYWSPYAARRSIIPELPLTRVVPPRLLGGVYRLTEPIAHAVHVGQMNCVRREFGLPPLPRDLRVMYTEGDWVLYPDIPEYLPTPNRPDNHVYVGICDWVPASEKPDWWDRMLADSRPKVFVTLGSSGPLPVIRALVEALAGLPACVVLSTSGRSLPGLPGDWYVTGLLPFTETARAARVVVSHGGSGGLYPALAAGTPVLGIPSNADQQLSTAVLVGSGAGLGVRVEEASPGRLRQALGKLLSDPAYPAAARRWAEVFSRYDSGVIFRSFVQRALPHQEGV